MKQFLSFLRGLFQKKKLEAELNEELNFHLSMQVEQNLQKGMSREEATRQATVALGGWEQIKESCRDVRPAAFFDTWMQDFRYAFRSLLRSPGFLMVVLLTLVLAIGANTAIFTVARAVLLRPLPYPDPDRLMMIWMREKDGSTSVTNYATYKDWKDRLHSFQAIVALSSWEPTLYGYGEPTPLEGLSVTREFLTVLGIRPYLGRDFLPEEDRPDHNRVVMLTHRFWQQRVGGDPSIVGKQINLSGIPRTVVGILPPHFESIIRYNFKESEIFRPLGYDETLPWACRDCNHLTALGRIESGISMSQAAQEIDSFTGELIAKYPQDYGTAGATLVPLHEQVVSNVKKVLILLLAGVALVLLIACSNIAALMLARATRRSQEIAIRTALGASRGRLLRQLLTESTLLALAGGTLGVLFSVWATSLLVRYAPAAIPRLQNVSMDLHVLLFAASATVVAGLIFGLIPALKASQPHVQANLQASGRSVSADRQNLRKGLVIANIALALVLLSGAALLFATIRNLLSQKLGFQEHNVVTMMINLTGHQYEDRVKVDSYYQQVLDRVRSLPGVERAGVVSQLPLSTNLDMYGVEVRDKPLANRGAAPSAERFAITPGYLDALRIPVLQGRGITTQDHADSMPVVLVNRT
ncbi:MAG TPA: ADOP family duplicated permease, partial [Acidobacteriota bacterium]